ncbi:MAG: enoyl-CoA hydratase/isomerase family protein [Sciscionella sp.]
MTAFDVVAAGSVEVTDDSTGLRTVLLNRPAVRNALTPADLDTITDAVRSAAAHRNGLVFTGSGERSFCAGMHLRSFTGLTVATARELITRVAALLTAVRTSPLPTLAMVNGFCLGIGFELSLCCDVRVAAETARFGLPEVALGIPSIADAALLQQHVGLSLAKEMILTGEVYSVDALRHTGLLNRIVSPGELAGASEELMTSIRRHTPTVLASQKRLFEAWQNSTLSAGIEASVGEFAGVFAHQETLAAIRRHTGNRQGTPSDAAR